MTAAITAVGLPVPTRPAMARAHRLVAQQMDPACSGHVDLVIDDPATARTVSALVALASSWARGQEPDMPAADHAAALVGAADRLDMAD